MRKTTSEYMKKYARTPNGVKKIKAYYRKNRSKILSKSKQLSGRDRVERNKKAMVRWQKKGITYTLWAGAKYRAAQKGIEFTIKREDIVIPNICPYLGCPITTIFSKGRIGSNPSIDRKNPLKGYTKNNIQIISIKANIMKSNSTEEELVEFARNVLRIHQK